MINQVITFLFVVCSLQIGLSQQRLTGNISSAGDEPLAYVTVVLDGQSVTYTDDNGDFNYDHISGGQHTLEVSHLGYISQEIEVADGQAKMRIVLQQELNLFDEIVVTGTKTFKRQTESPIIVNVIDHKTLENVQACNLSEGLNFQAGLRVETDCQTCNYTQLRMNGLAGSYSQILINGRPIFSPLTGLYGLEQIPVNMIDRIEVVRGGGSSLYGSSAIGGTVNIMTSIPQNNSGEFSTTYQSVGGAASDLLLTGNGALVNDAKSAGVSIFGNYRDRDWYDHNGDNFSELPALSNTSVGVQAYYLPSDNQKIELSISNLNEYRYGGEMIDTLVHLAQQAEERTHNVYMGSLDYQINFNEGNSSLITYAGWQLTHRDHYTGILPDSTDQEAFLAHIESPPYGTSKTTTGQYGLQYNHLSTLESGLTHQLTVGTEYLLDDIVDEIPAYNYQIDQLTTDIGTFVQSDFEVLPSLNLLSGIRVDKHNLIDELVWSPRLSMIYKYGAYTQIRGSFGTGFRAPQAFDTDLHIAFAGGGISRVMLADDLGKETSQSYSLSLNYDRPTDYVVAGFTVEGFYTRLDDAFYLDPVGADDFGEIFTKRNGQGATVQGINFETRANYRRKVQLETGFTLQSSRFDEAVEYIDGLAGTTEFIRTPNFYGFANLSFTPSDRLSANVNFLHTGSMLVPHFAGSVSQLVDEMVTTGAFNDVSFKVAYTLPISKAYNFNLYGGVKNAFNAYQSDFDIGKDRDSNYIYGPSTPRTVYVGVKWEM